MHHTPSSRDKASIASNNSLHSQSINQCQRVIMFSQSQFSEWHVHVSVKTDANTTSSCCNMLSQRTTPFQVSFSYRAHSRISELHCYIYIFSFFSRQVTECPTVATILTEVTSLHSTPSTTTEGIV